jgi:arylsulfatase A-like enzyme
LSGAEVPEWMEGKDLLAEGYKREYVVSARDRCDYTIDRVRAITTERFKYIRNFLTDRPFMQAQYRDETPFMIDMRNYYETGKMNSIQRFIWAETRVPEELYDLKNDPYETINLAEVPEYAGELAKHQRILEEWIEDTGDKGQFPETDAALKGVLQQWSAKAVNPEYDKVKYKLEKMK